MRHPRLLFVCVLAGVAVVGASMFYASVWSSPPPSGASSVPAPAFQQRSREEMREERRARLEGSPTLALDPANPQCAMDVEAALLAGFVELPGEGVAVSKSVPRSLAATLARHALARASGSSDAYMALTDQEATRWRTADEIGKGWVNVQGRYNQMFDRSPPRDDLHGVVKSLLDKRLADSDRLTDLVHGEYGVRVVVGRVKSADEIADFSSRSPGPAGLGHWISGASTVVTRFRAPRTPFEEIVRRDGSVQAASVSCVFKVSSGRRVIIRGDWFYDPAVSQWFLHRGSHVGNFELMGVY